ncbi:6-phosphogluconate dehydrogenase C-terminal domain-like protein [Daldinia loculata]|uniref:6-phosphogluconate dehydrogenase C-terminal domain-like protein n=1 Tax=Daldinia loculata TaxID=103429 RepID=UPI0020C417EF|nr:6-phosphogluconate dehydrogenase C-terminal domain-like protein [Daldinia loculata]KAI1647518.1 6-phosphogluconate dehydrogenase C-terminal domain-like protein [Daldinia loculata]
MNSFKASWCRHSLRMVPSSTGSRQVPTEWLRRVTEDQSEPPRLYAWRLTNLPDGANYARKPLEVGEIPNPDNERRRIYILGVGNIGRLYASFLAKNDSRPPITLVVHRRELLDQWKAHPGIELVRDGKTERNPAFRIEWWADAQPMHGPVREPGSGCGISNLIVATKAPDAIPQVDRVRRYLDSRSTVAFAQNGMCKLWPPLGEAYVAARFGQGKGPRWLACVTTHGVTSLGPFQSVHASPADVRVGSVMVRGGDGWDGNDNDGDKDDYLAEQIVGAPGLAARRVATRELWVAQLEKLVVNAVINPLTAVLRCKNGEVFEERGDGLGGVVEMLVEEASRTLRALVGHRSSEGILFAQDKDGKSGVVTRAAAEERLERTREELLERFSSARLRTMLYSVGEKVAANTSSMLQDVQAGKKTEIEDFNGWLVETAQYLGDEGGLPVNKKLISLIEDGAARTRDELVKELQSSRG